MDFVYRLKSFNFITSFIIDSGSEIHPGPPPSFQPKIKEALHMHWEKPSLNRQIFHVILSLAI